MALTSDFNPAALGVTYQRMRMLLAEQGGGIQEGVVSANDLKVVQRGAGANQSVDVGLGAAWVQIDTGTRNGLAHCYNDATANVTVTASNGTNPRVDQIILRYNDSFVPTGSGSVPTLEVLTGTATAGATLDNRTGATALPNDCLRLADILVPTSSTSVTTANIRDRRPWARGVYNRIIRTSGNMTTTSSTMADLDGTNLVPRIECSGVPLRVTLRAAFNHSVVDGAGYLAFAIDGTLVDGSNGAPFTIAPRNSFIFQAFTWDVVPAAGSHIVSPRTAISTAGTFTIACSATSPLVFTVEEIVRPNANNS